MIYGRDQFHRSGDEPIGCKIPHPTIPSRTASAQITGFRKTLLVFVTTDGAQLCAFQACVGAGCILCRTNAVRK